MAGIPIISLCEPCLRVPAGATAAQVLAMNEGHAFFFVITVVDDEGINRPVAIATAPDLLRLKKAKQPLSELRSRLPSLISLVEEAETVDEDWLIAIAEALSVHSDIKGIFLAERSSNVRVLSRSKIAAALPLERIATRSPRLENAPAAQEIKYVCRRCDPPSYRLSRTADGPAPECQLMWYHGPMERAVKSA